MEKNTTTQIYKEYLQGQSVPQLAAKYGVREETIRGIIANNGTQKQRKLRPKNPDIEILCDSASESFFQREWTSIGVKKINLCRYCATRTSPQTCPFFWKCYAHWKEDGFPYTMPWTEWLEKPRHYDRETDPDYRHDPITGYLKPEYV